VQDDGIGLADAATALQRGNGLGGMQERVWALGGVWHSGPAAAAHPPDAAPTPATPSAPLPPRPGWRLQAHLPLAARSATPTSTEGRDG
jgi:two-component system sensor histidine kinase UhpB